MTTTAAAATWTADTVHSTAEFAVKHSGRRDLPRKLQGRHRQPRPVRRSAPHRRGRRPEHPGRDENLYGHLQSADFFDAENTPKVTFASTSVTRDGDDVTVEGDLTIKGTTQRVTATGTWLEVEADMGGQPAHRRRHQHDDRPHRVRAELERPRCPRAASLANDVTLHVHLELVPVQG